MSLIKKMMFTHSANGHLVVAASLDVALAMGLCDEDQQLYLWVVDSAARLGRVNIKTAKTEVIGKLGITMDEISFNDQGYLLGSSGKDLYRINTRNGALSRLSSADVDDGSHTPALTGNTPARRSLVGALRSDTDQSPAQLAFELARLFIKLYSVDEENLVQLAILDGRTMDIGVFGYGTIYGRAASNISRFQMENPGIYTTNSLTGRTTTLADHLRKPASLLAEAGY